MPSTSPFPGLDPWLEEHWGDVHTRFMVYASDQIDKQLPPDLQVRVEESLGIDVELATQRYIEVIDARSDRVVTVIELLSPGNKTSGERRAEYRKKQREFIAGGVNLVEIDLIRAGLHVLGIPEQKIPTPLAGQSLVCVHRATRRWAELYGAPLREPLPNIRIPPGPTDADVVLQLQPVFNEIYRKGRYDSIDYRRPPVPRLSAEDERWVAEVLQKTSS